MPSLELRIPPLLLTAAFLALVWGASLLWPGGALPFPGHRAAAIALAALGLVVLLGAALQFRLQGTTLNPLAPDQASRFVAQGLYRVSRNPMYLGMALLLLGAACWTSNAAAYGLVVMFCTYLTVFQIKPEERALQARFGSEYLSYKAKVRRWV